ncbi:MAG: hypothetical protein PHS04_04545 [Tissierellia bacterium]|jgi:hypothetical protein|nr:hypothetical protein [Tissierellia bacterium]
MIQVDYSLRYYLHIEPDALSDDEWAVAIKALEWLRKNEAKTTKAMRELL